MKHTVPSQLDGCFYIILNLGPNRHLKLKKVPLSLLNTSRHIGDKIFQIGDLQILIFLVSKIINFVFF